MRYIDVARETVENSLCSEPIDKLRSISERISESYHYESGAGKRLITQDLQAAVYAAVRMPATFGAVWASLGYALDIYPVKGKSLIDAGAGTGAATLAAAELLELKQITCLEREDTMGSIGKKLISECGKQFGNDGLSRAEWVKSDIVTHCFEKSAALVISSYMLNEMDAKTQAQIIEKLWNATEELLLIVEPGTPEGYQVIRRARELLLSKGAHIAAPCTHEKICAIQDNDWCHFTERIQRSRLHKLIKNADVPYEDEKFSYIAFTREKCEAGGYRIMRHPDIHKGNIRLRVCNEEKIGDMLITKKNGELFKKARKASNGNIFYIN